MAKLSDVQAGRIGEYLCSVYAMLTTGSALVPFPVAADDDHRDLVCTLHRGLVEGMVGGLKPPLAVKEFKPFVERGICRLRAG